MTLLCNGFAEYVLGLANALAKYADVSVIHPEAISGVCESMADPDVKLLSFYKPPRRRNLGNIPAMKRAFELVRQTQPDVLHVQEFFDYAFDFYLGFTRLPPLVTTIHDVVPHPGDGQASFGLEYTKAITVWRSTRLMVHTEGMRKHLAARFRLSPERVDVAPHGELGSLYERVARNAGVPAAPREPYTLLFFGRIWPYKGLRYLLEAFQIVKQDLPDARLLICGRGGDLDVHAALIASLSGVEVQKGFIPEEAVAGLFEQSSVVVLPYIEASQSGVSATGFTTGTVVVASRVGGLADLIADEETGLLVEPRNSQALAAALIRLLKDRELQQRLRENAYAVGQSTLAWSTIAEQTMSTYRRALADRRPVASETLHRGS